MLNIESDDDELAQVKCSCDAICSGHSRKVYSKYFEFMFLTPPFPHSTIEPVFVRLTLSFSDSSSVSLYHLYQPPSSLPPHGGSCSALFSTLGEEEEGGEVVSLLSFVVVTCEGWEFEDGMVSVLGEKIYFMVEDEGEGAVESPLSYPPKTTSISFFPLHFFSFSLSPVALSFSLSFSQFLEISK